MEQESSVFLNKFIASLCVRGVKSIPFAGDEFQKGISAMENVMYKDMTKIDFDKVSEMFVKVPVEETYQQIRQMFMNLNGYGISFSGADNPLWSVMTIKMTSYSANRILNDNSVMDFDAELMDKITEEFCEAAGVPIWEVF